MIQTIKLIEVPVDHGPEFEALLNDLEMKHYLTQLKYERIYIFKIRNCSQNKQYLKLQNC